MLAAALLSLLHAVVRERRMVDVSLPTAGLLLWFVRLFRPSLLPSFQANILRSGFLQLAAGTHVVLDETALTAGQLHGTGVQNMRALQVI